MTSCFYPAELGPSGIGSILEGRLCPGVQVLHFRNCILEGLRGKKRPRLLALEVRPFPLRNLNSAYVINAQSRTDV